MLNFSAPTGDSAPSRMAKPKGGRWKDRVKVVKSVKRRIEVAGRPQSYSASTTSERSTTGPSTHSFAHDSSSNDRSHSRNNNNNSNDMDIDDYSFSESAGPKEAKMMHGKSQVQSSIFSPDDEIVPKVKSISYLKLTCTMGRNEASLISVHVCNYLGQHHSPPSWQAQQRTPQHLDIHRNRTGPGSCQAYGI